MSNHPVDVRLCTPDDLALLESREVRPGSNFAQRNLALAGSGDFFFVGAFTPDDVAGYVALDCRADNELRPEMLTLWVYPEYRRQGLGVKLTRFIEGIAAQQGFNSVKLGVDPENPAAIPMYIGLDYTPTGDHRVVTDEDGAETREAIFRKSLTINR
ncbi:MAG TPA: GNAT family N-acetyltransferase [Propioniciclava tarda]|nr:GNAT family N-acetyltransferase [Propioniciclava tarda]HQA29884.1 GNAT family N-acetyltransferase [Propioniciclava tarda]HQD60719.1 GNAT family N-acetyltransferase [Propioniciclava tarda]